MKRGLTSAQLTLVAERFKILAEPARLQLLQALMPGELSVGQLVEKTGLSQAGRPSLARAAAMMRPMPDSSLKPR